VTAIVQLDGVSKDYRLGKVTVPAVRDVSFHIDRGDFVSIAGPSGSGKTTLLNLIGCVDTATAGRVLVDGQDTGRLSDRALTDLRLHKLGFIFQSFNLIGVLDVYRNVEFPLLLKGDVPKKERHERVRAFIDRVGLTEHLRHRPNELSGGQRQRVAIARALVTLPRIVLADEPTANLDTKTGGGIIDLMKDINEAEQTTFIFSTHDARVMSHADRVIRLLDGRIVSNGQESAGQSPEAAEVAEG
jgi:putative ABC transport system ATP-binding protein